MKLQNLKIYFLLILGLMLCVTTWATFQESITVGGPLLTHEPWGLATLADAYCGFLTFFAWVLFKEKTVLAKMIWFLLIMLLGNIAMSTYVLIQIWRLPRGAGFGELLTHRSWDPTR